MLSSTVGSYSSTPSQFLLSVLTLVPSHVDDMPFLSTRRSLNSFTKRFPLGNLLLIAMVGNFLAILYLLESFKSLIQGKVVKLYTDSKNAFIIASKGSTSLRLQCQALEIFQF